MGLWKVVSAMWSKHRPALVLADPLKVRHSDFPGPEVEMKDLPEPEDEEDIELLQEQV